ncbi:hypothetical protein [Microviridae sp.]|nr:hypothetical protein [Microviridae sp.]
MKGGDLNCVGFVLAPAAVLCVVVVLCAVLGVQKLGFGCNEMQISHISQDSGWSSSLWAMPPLSF